MKQPTYLELRTKELLEFAKTDVVSSTHLAIGVGSNCFASFFDKLTSEQRQLINPSLK